MRALQYLVSPSRIWAIEEGAWQEMVEIVKGNNLSVTEIEAALGRKLDNKATNAFNIEDGVAIIPVIGPIVKRGDLFSDVSGATSVTRITKDFQDALSDDSVKSILFDIDSPGGEANGINEISEMIYQARGTKPIESYVSGLGCSAAYWIASATDQIWADETATLGSIGVAGVIRSTEERDEKAGIKTYKFVSDGSENKRPNLDTDEGKALVQSNIDAMAKVFRAKVARNRSSDDKSYTIKDVIEKFNRGGTLLGQDAVTAGLADGLSSKQEVINSLITRSGENNETSLNLKEKIMTDKKKVNASEEGVVDDVLVAKLESEINTLTTTNETLVNDNKTLADNFTTLAEELKTIKANMSATQDENLKLKAQSESLNLSDRMTPAQKEAFVSDYVFRAKDDIANPIEGFSRVDSLLQMWEGSPTHNLKEETLDPDNTLDLSNAVVEEEDDIAQAVANAKEFAKMQNSRLHA